MRISCVNQVSYPKNFFNKSFFDVRKNIAQPKNILSFLGYPVYIVDGGAHADNMEHFANAISKDMETQIRPVETLVEHDTIKNLKSLEKRLQELNEEDNLKNAFVAVPALATVPLLNIQAQYNRLMGENIKLTPENIKSHKKDLLEFLKKIYDYPSIYSQYARNMDSTNQGLQYVWGVIQEINKLVKKGAKVYVPSGHPQDQTLKWMAEQRGYKPELYYYIAKGKDKDNVITKMHNEIKENNWYDFNLLALSDANIVGVKGAKGPQDYMFAAYDSCITDGERGVYNFTPIRENNEIIGYSYTDKKTVEYPFDEFPANDKIANISKFVGKDYLSTIASKKDIEKLKECLKEGKSTQNCADKLYPVEEVFSKEEIKNKKIDLQGRFVDKSLELFFDTNHAGDIIFPKCDCEGSGKPSVLSMWGSCFSTFNAIARDIKLKDKIKHYYGDNIETNKDVLDKKIDNLIVRAEAIIGLSYITQPSYNLAQDYLNDAIERSKLKKEALNLPYSDYRPHALLGDLHFKQGKYELAQACYNQAINALCDEYFAKRGDKTLEEYKTDYEKYIEYKQADEEYDRYKKEFDGYSFFKMLISKYPNRPIHYGEFPNHKEGYNIFENVAKKCAQLYSKMSDVCDKRGEKYPANVCRCVSEDILDGNQRAERVIGLRKDGVYYIGDLYPHISKGSV
ncbi:MAG: hypothetical protein IJD57_03820 [Candidatus Gastranaerophilales bacterium]|nr:hypothetical protein [Candidatus Gastranaerophilales bacterium]